MFLRVVLLFSLSSLTCGAQTAETLSQSRAQDDLHAIRASMEEVKKGQATLILLQRIQTAQMRLSSLEQQRIQLLVQERLLEGHSPGSRATGPSGNDSDVLVAVQTSEAGSVQAVPARELNISVSNRNEDALLREVRQLRAANDKEIKALSNRIAAWETKLEEPLR